MVHFDKNKLESLSSERGRAGNMEWSPVAGTYSDGGSPNMHSLQLVCNWGAAARPGLGDSPEAPHTPSVPPDVLRAPGGLSKARACCRAIRWAETWFSYGCPAASSWNKLLLPSAWSFRNQQEKSFVEEKK